MTLPVLNKASIQNVGVSVFQADMYFISYISPILLFPFVHLLLMMILYNELLFIKPYFIVTVNLKRQLGCFESHQGDW